MKIRLAKNGETDKYGTNIAALVSGADATPQKIYDWLWENGFCGCGYKFVIVIDLSHDEYEPPEKQTPLYFMDEVADEVMEQVGLKEASD